MKSYEGKCTYCEATDIIMAESQEAADETVSNNCECKGASEAEKKAKYIEQINYIADGNFSDVFMPLSNEQKQALRMAGQHIIDGMFAEIAVKVIDSTIKLWRKGDKYKVSRKTTCEEEAEA